MLNNINLLSNIKPDDIVISPNGRKWRNKVVFLLKYYLKNGMMKRKFYNVNSLTITNQIKNQMIL
jgi:hypothetical protein